MMVPASFPKTVQFRVSEKKCDWEIKEEPQPHPKRETVEEGSSRMWKGEQRQHDLDDIGRYRALVGQVDSTIAVEGLNNQDLAEYANSCRMWTGFAEIAKARGRGYNRQAPVPDSPRNTEGAFGGGDSQPAYLPHRAAYRTGDNNLQSLTQARHRAFAACIGSRTPSGSCCYL